MPRPSFDAGEADSNLKIEDGVRQALKSNSIARVATKAIENDYDLYDEELPSEQGSLEAKCKVISKLVGADLFEIKAQEVWFRKRPLRDR